MLFVRNFNGKAYSRLDEVLGVRNKNKKKLENQEGFEKLSKAVDENYYTHTAKIRKNGQKRNLQKKDKKDIYIKHKDKPTSNALPNIYNKGLNKTNQNFSSIILKKQSLHETFVKKFISAIRNNDSELLNKEKCIKIIDDSIFFVNRTNLMHGLNERDEKRILNNNSNNILEKTKFENRSKSVMGPESKPRIENQKLVEVPKVEDFEPKNMLVELGKNNGKSISSKFVTKLKNCLAYLFYNNITIERFLKDNPFPRKPLCKEKGKEFFNAIKLGDDAAVIKLLKIDKTLIYEKDYLRQTGYHWSAKRGQLSTLKILFQYGNHPNFVDINKRTPLYLAAMNNHIETVEYLLKMNANPSMMCSQGKRPVHVTTDVTVRRLLESARKTKRNWNCITDIIKYHKEKSLAEILENQQTPVES